MDGETATSSETSSDTPLVTDTPPPTDETKVPEGTVQVIELIDGREIYLGKIKNRQTIEAALVHLSNITGGANTVKAGEIIINSCRLGGTSLSELEKEDPEMFCSACVSACSMINLEQAKLKKL